MRAFVSLGSVGVGRRCLSEATGVISGIPTMLQVAPITVEVTHSGGNVASEPLSIMLDAAGTFNGSVDIPPSSAPRVLLCLLAMSVG